VNEHALRLGDVRSPWLRGVLAGLSIVVVVWVLNLTSYWNFFLDEWGFIELRRPWHLDLILLPHREHWSTLPILLWKVLFSTVGIRSHVPYEAALLVVHVVAVFLLFALVRRRSGDIPAFGAALILLVLGSGADGIIWAFQVGWTGSVAFGLLAMLLLDGDPAFPGRLAPVSAALLGSLMCSSVGLAFLVAIGVELLADPRRRRLLLALVVPTAAFVAWFLAFDTGRPGYGGIEGDFLQGATGWSYVVNLLGFIVTGLAASAIGLAGAAGILSVVLALVLAFLVTRAMQRRVEAWQLGMIAGTVFFFALVATGRVQYGVDLAKESRYLYVGAVFLLPLVAHSLRSIPWRGLWRPALVAGLAVCVIGNTIRLHDAALNLIYYMGIEDAELQTVEVFRGAPDMALDHYIDNTVVSSMYANVYLAAIDELGSPVPPMTLDGLRRLPHLAVDRVMRNLFGPSIKVETDRARSTAGLQCRSVDSTPGAAIDLRVPAGKSFLLSSTKGGEASIYMGFLDAPTDDMVQKVRLQAASPVWVRMPDTGKPTEWQLRIATASTGTVQLCTSS